MADTLTPEERSRLIGRVRGKDTKPERIVRSLLHRLGYRFTIEGPLNRSLPGRPDIVLPKYRTVIFVHGCFWHRHEGCPKTTTPSTRRESWEAKFHANVARDRRVSRALRKDGWRVLTVWEYRIADPESLSKSLRRRIRCAPGAGR